MILITKFNFTLLFIGLFNLHICVCEDESTTELFKIEGKVFRPDSSIVSQVEWFANTKVITNTGLVGFLREDGVFVIHNVPWGSHVIHVMNPTYAYEPIRVDVSSKGKQRARVVNLVQPSKVDLLPYPLRMKTVGMFKYFQQREQLRVTDFLMNPMVLMTVVPLFFLMVLPRLSDPEARKDMEQLQMPKVDTPELSEIMTNLFGGGGGSGSSSAPSRQSRVKPGKKKDKIHYG